REAELLLGRGPYPPPVPMTLDFYLPLPLLLSGGIAHWRVRTPASPHGERLGSAYRIVLHSYERSFAPHWSGARLRMRRRLELAAREGAGLVRGLPPAAPPGRAHDALADPRIAVCTVGPGADGAGAARALVAALEAGVPTLVWRIARPGAGAGRRPGAVREGPGDSWERRGGGGGKEPLLPWNGPPIFDKLIYRGSLSLSVAEIGDLPRRLHEWRIESTDTDISDPMHTEHDDPFDIALLTDHAAPPTAARHPAPAGSDVIPPPRAGRSGPAPAAPPPRRAPLPGAAPISAPDDLLDSAYRGPADDVRPGERPRHTGGRRGALLVGLPGHRGAQPVRPAAARAPPAAPAVAPVPRGSGHRSPAGGPGRDRAGARTAPAGGPPPALPRRGRGRHRGQRGPAAAPPAAGHRAAGGGQVQPGLPGRPRAGPGPGAALVDHQPQHARLRAVRVRPAGPDPRHLRRRGRGARRRRPGRAPPHRRLPAAGAAGHRAAAHRP